MPAARTASDPTPQTGADARSEPRRRAPAPAPRAAERALHPRPRHPSLHDPGEEEAEHERPPDLPRHLEGVPQAVEQEHAPRLAMTPSLRDYSSGVSPRRSAGKRFVLLGALAAL